MREPEQVPDLVDCFRRHSAAKQGLVVGQTHETRAETVRGDDSAAPVHFGGTEDPTKHRHRKIDIRKRDQSMRPVDAPQQHKEPVRIDLIPRAINQRRSANRRVRDAARQPEVRMNRGRDHVECGYRDFANSDDEEVASIGSRVNPY